MDHHKIPEIRIYSPVQDSVEERTCHESDLRRQTFDMRTANLSNFPVTSSAYKLSHYRSHHHNLITRAKSHVTLNPVKSLNLLREALQNSVNQELDQVIKKYLNTFFKPAIRNIRGNSGDGSVSDYHVQAICRQVLEEAKKMYFSGNGQPQHCGGSNLSASPSMPLSELSDSDSVHQNQYKKRVKAEADSDDSEHEMTENVVKVRRGPKKNRKKLMTETTNKQHFKSKGISENGGRSGFRWDPDRLTETTKFVLGSRANKALGFGMTRGRLYTKHADLFRYIGDMEDKQWLSERGLMPTSGGRAYLLIMQDIDDLLRSADYCGVPGVDPSEMGSGFTVPKKMISKMKSLMQATRTTAASAKANAVENNEPDSRPESSIGKRDEGDEGDGRSLTGDEISNILLNSADIPSTVASPASSSKAFSPPVDDSPLVMDQFL